MTLQEYLAKDPSLREPVPSPEMIQFTKKSRASREISLHGPGSVRGLTHFYGFPTRYESEVEQLIALSYLGHPNVVDIIGQPLPVYYYDDAGVLHKTISTSRSSKTAAPGPWSP